MRNVCTKVLLSHRKVLDIRCIIRKVLEYIAHFLKHNLYVSHTEDRIFEIYIRPLICQLRHLYVLEY